MRKFILTIILLLNILIIYAQPINYVFNTSEFNIVKSYPIERVYFYSENKIEGENVISCGEGYYMIKVDNVPDFKIKFNKENNKAIIDWTLHPVIFTVEENDNRITLYTNRPYFGFIYDKRYKVLYSFTSRKYYRHIRKHIRYGKGY